MPLPPISLASYSAPFLLILLFFWQKKRRERREYNMTSRRGKWGGKWLHSCMIGLWLVMYENRFLFCRLNLLPFLGAIMMCKPPAGRNVHCSCFKVCILIASASFRRKSVGGKPDLFCYNLKRFSKLTNIFVSIFRSLFARSNLFYN